jgi:argininosuccinate lyase
MLLATDLADYLVIKGVPFRQAHEVIGKLVAHCLGTGRSFPELGLEEYRQFSEAFGEDVFGVLKMDTALAARQGIGAPSPSNVAGRLEHWREKLT